MVDPPPLMLFGYILITITTTNNYIIFSNSLTKSQLLFSPLGENHFILVCRQGGGGASSPAHADGRSETGSYDLNQKNLVQ